jgi:hypothetical protein
MSLLLPTFARMPRPLYWASLAHAALAAACLVALLLPAASVMGVHPALKPLKFTISIALFLASLGVLLPALSLSPAVRSALAWLFAATMAAEIVPILVQALRGTTSHFNTRAPLDAAAWNLMFLAILLATLGMIYTTFVATFRPLTDGHGGVMHPLLALAWRAGLWLLLLSPVSGFAMGGRLQHSVGGADGGPGLPLVNWSVIHGDLRVAHFFALHALQLLPLLAGVLLLATARPWLRWSVLSTAILTTAALCLGTLAQAFAGRPFLSLSSPRGAAPPADPSGAPRAPQAR